MGTTEWMILFCVLGVLPFVAIALHENDRHCQIDTEGRMMLWLLERTDSVGYDEYDSLVVRAASEDEARKVADSSHCYGPWLDTQYCVVKRIDVDGEAEIVHASFCAG